MSKPEALFTDERLEWLKDRLVLGLNLKEVPREQLVEVLTKYELADFLNGKTTRTAVVFVAVDHVETIQADSKGREEEDEEEQKNEADEGETPDGVPPDDTAPGEGAQEGGEEKKEGEDGQPKEGEEASKPTEEEQQKEEEEEEEEAPEEKKEIEVHITDLNFYFDNMPAIPQEARVMAFYILIGAKKAIPRDRNKIGQCFSFQVIPGNCLEGLADSLNNVYTPVFSQHCEATPDRSDTDPLSSGVDADFLSVFQKFVDEINHSVRKIRTVHNIVFPPPVNEDPQKLAQNEQYTTHLDQVLDHFTSLIAQTIDQLSKQTPDAPGPLAEVELWRSRYIISSSLREQLQSPNLPQIIQVLDLINSQSLNNFNMQLEDLDRYVKQAKSNVDFLSLLERHFRNLQTCPLQTIYNSLSSIMDNLRLIWITSNYYNTDTLMAPLIERISHQLSDRVVQEIRTDMLRGPLDQAISQTETAYNVLTNWHDRFNETRALIEKKNHIPRWDFEQSRLFERPLYIAERCKELKQIAEKLRELYLILGPELKSVTNNPHVIDETRAQVDDLITPLVPVPFDIFDKRFRAPWEAVFNRFLASALKIQEQLSGLINTSFKDLRSSEAGLDLLDRFKKIQLAGDMKEQMDGKYSDVLQKYSEEVTAIQELYNQQWSNPPILPHHPPITGRISWARSLFIRMKKPMLRLRMHPQITDSPLFEGPDGVKAHYAEVAKLIDKQNMQLFQEWSSKTESIARISLEKPILKSSKATLHKVQIHQHHVNFDPELQQMINEGKHLERMGYTLSRDVVNVLLQYPHYRKLQRSLEAMLSEWNNAISSINADEVRILTGCMRAVEDVFADGASYLNWNSLGVNDFLSRCQRAIHQFKSAANSVSSNVQKINKAIKFIGDCITIPDKLPPEITTLSEFQNYLTEYQEKQQKEILSQYLDIPPQLRIIEGNALSVIKDNAAQPGALKQKNEIQAALCEYYIIWETRILNALTRSTLLSLLQLQLLMESPDFQVVTRLAPPKLAYQPSFESITKAFTKLFKLILATSNVCLQWKEGTCIIPLQQSNNEDNEVELKHFGMRVQQCEKVQQITNELQAKVEATCKAIEEKAGIFEQYQHIWMDDRKQIVDMFKQRNPTIAEFDSRMTNYRSLTNEITTLPATVEIDFVTVDFKPVIDSIKAECGQWLSSYGVALAEILADQVKNMDTELTQYTNDMKRELKERSDLEFVLQVINKARDNSVTMERQMDEIEERSRTLTIFKLPQPEGTGELIKAFRQRWATIMDDSAKLDVSLQETKEKFKQYTLKEVDQFTIEVGNFSDKFEKEGPGNPETPMDQGLQLVLQYKQEHSDLCKRRDELHLAEKLFGIPLTSFPQLQHIATQLNQYQQIYQLYDEQQRTMGEWSALLWSEVNIDLLTNGIDGFEMALRKLPHALRGLPPYEFIKKDLAHFKESLPLFQDLKNEALRDRHWSEMMVKTGAGVDFQPNAVTLANIFKMNLLQYADVISDVTNTATKELIIEKGISELAETWNKMRFSVHPYRRSPTSTEDRGFILAGIEDILQTLDDNKMKLQTLSSSRFVAHFQKQVREWEIMLSQIGDLTSVWLQVQLKWMYLESIFIGSEDIKQQLPEEAAEFVNIDQNWFRLMQETRKNTLVISAVKTPDRLNTLQSLVQRLDKCQRSLSDYLETKRIAFPRFFFISDDELLSILGSGDPTSVQQHMIKLFDNGEALIFKNSRGSTMAAGMVSSEKESFDFRNLVAAEGPVEEWMLNVEHEMQRTLYQIMKEAVIAYPKHPRTEWIMQFIGMCVLMVSQIWWTYEVEDAFQQVRQGNKLAMKEMRTKLMGQINDIVKLVRSNLDLLARKKINTLIIVDVHARDLVDGFVRDSILDAREFQWESQLRYYWDRTLDDVAIRQCTGSFSSGYEYMGLNGRLVITPLTDRCIMTLTQALSMGFGGSPAGPAGTGKTETVKDLAKAMCRLCNVFNCGEGLDHKAMARIFSGLVQTGGWGCFDEFNRIEPEVLSVISGHIRVIQAAFKAGARQFVFEGRKIPLNPGFGIFITMNPGYAGRSELPDNLKAMFRPVVMVVPNTDLICEVMLFSEGFEMNTHTLAKKMITIYQMAGGQLSKQHHYDWGLRALKSVLTRAGELKRANTQLSEEVVLMTAIRDMNMPKFTFEDTPLFVGLLNDLFPDIELDPVHHPQLSEKIDELFEELGYSKVEKQMAKVIQLHETMNARHTTMVVGNTGGGKSVIIDIMAKAQTRLGTLTRIYTINPKACTVLELYGVLDPTTRDWKWGLFSKIFKEINQTTDKKEARYINFDGDVDAVWVENMNSVMDDNKLLTLANSERIRLLPHCALLFEVGDLQYASPATVSRCGMVFMDPRNLSCTCYYERWLKVNKRPESNILNGLFERYVMPCVNFINGKVSDTVTAPPLETIIPVTAINMVRQLCCLLQSMLPEEGEEIKDAEVLESIFIFCVMWSLGGSLVDDSMLKFDQFVKRLSNWVIIDAPGRLAKAGQLPGTSPTLYEFEFNVQQQQWIPWSQKIQGYEIPLNVPFNQIIVPTIDTARNQFILEHVVMKSKQPIMFVGKSGTAKTATIMNFLSSFDQERYMTRTLNFSNCTTSMDVQLSLEENFDNPTKDTAVPQGGKEMVVFIDDINMPTVDTYGTQQPIALLKLLIDRGGMYDRGGDLIWKQVQKVFYMTAMAPPGGARAVLDPRFVSLFNIFHVVSPSDESLHHIFNTILGNHTKNFSDEIQHIYKTVTDATITFYDDVVAKLPPTPSKFHYLFNLRDLSRVFEGLCKSTPSKNGTLSNFIRLWRNECLRVFHDRLTNMDDRNFVMNKLETLVDINFNSVREEVVKDPSIFGDFIPEGDADGPFMYQDLDNYSKLYDTFTEIMEEFALAKKTKAQIVLFDYVIEHLTRILRIIKTPRGNALLIGIGGSGKKSLTRLAAYAAGYEVFEITLTRTYNEADFREDLKKLYKLVGVEKKQVVFLFADSHIMHESFLELINNMLTSGVVPALFTQEDKDGFSQYVQEDVVRQGLFVSPENCWRVFIDRCRDNLHIVLCFSPSGDDLRRRCRDFPGLVNNTVIDWFDPWPDDALSAVSKHFLEQESALIPDAIFTQVVNHMVLAHQQAVKCSAQFSATNRRHVHITPTNFLDYISTFRKLLVQKNQSIRQQIQTLADGLTSISRASKEVADLDERFKAQQLNLRKKDAENQKLMEQQTEKAALTEQKMTEASAKEIEIKESLEHIKVAKAQAQETLAEAQPVHEKAKKAVESIDPGEYSKFKSMASPPEIGGEIGKLICAMFNDGEGEESWAAARKYMAKPSFLSDMKNFNVREKCGNERKMRRVQQLLKQLEARKDDVNRAGDSPKQIFSWCQNTYAYYEVDKNVRPKELLVEKMENEQRKSQADFARIKNELRELQEEQSRVAAKLAQGKAEQEELKRQKDQLEHRLNAAQRLTAGFSSEKVRWTEDQEAYQKQLDCMVGDCLLAAAFLCYLGPLNQEFRSKLLFDILKPDLIERGVAVAPNFNLGDFLATEAEIFGWRGEGLPADELSIQNGLLITRANRFPLCIDPQLQVVQWIKQHVPEKQLKSTNFQEPDFAQHVENAIQYGSVVLFEGIDEFIDPLLTPVLEKNIITQGSRKMIKFNDKELDYDENFRIYLTTKLTSPNYSPEVSSRVAIVNCCVTENGLQEQLLDIVIANEHKDLHEEKIQLVKETSDNKRRLQTLQSTLLKLLSESTGYITDNEQLLATLEETKTEAADIAVKLESAQRTTMELDSLCNEFMPVAKRGSVLFFSMNNLSAINAMYEYSLASFSEVFVNSLKRSAPTPVVSKRIQNILGVLTVDVFEYVLTGLFEMHKLMYAFHMSLCIAREKGNVDSDVLDFLLKGNISLEKSSVSNPFPKWLPEQGWQDIQKLITVNDVFAKLVDDLTENEEVWNKYYSDPTPEMIDLPMGYQEKLDSLQRMSVLRCFRPDRLFLAARRYVVDNMGQQFSKFPIVNYNQLFEQSSPASPVLFILSPGADPASEVYKLADKLGLLGDESGAQGAAGRANRVRSIALGQDQEEPARQMIQAGANRGHWVILQNCHLLTSWLRELEKLVEKLALRPNPDFRLWLTSDPTNKFPVGLLQRCHKVVTEPPSGLQLNMRQSFSTITEEQFEECPHFAFQPLVYVLGFFHAVVQERRKYGKLGWNVAYDFNMSDFTVSMKLMSTYLTKAFDNKDTLIPWGSLRYLIGEAMYGGRVTDDFDRRVLMTYLDEYMGDFLFDDFQVFHFFSNEQTSYDLPKAKGLAEYIAAIDALPPITSPDVFGLHLNAEITFYQDSSRMMCQNLMNVHSSSGTSAGGVSKETQVASTVTEIQLKMKPPFNLNEVRASFGNETTPVQIVLIQELEHWNRLVNTMSTSLFELQRAIAGEVSMSNDLEMLMNSIYLGRLPEMWARLAPVTEKPLSNWLIHFQKRYEQYDDWYKNGEPKVMWLAGLHVPVAYLTALLQTACRSKGWPLDKATLMITVSSYQRTNQVMTKPALGCYLSGMYLEGASWDVERRCLIPQHPKELVMELPLLRVTPIEMNKMRTQNMLKTPIYLTQKRRDAMGVGLVQSAYLETSEHKSFWILQGVAISMNIR
ncbi:Dynein heavy chain family protein [Tritrichomonas foetus]|uniref:Dynein heavy chain family protein n=1 Tax=Tritrichomonas foetus TaxID=1144522 RepID=A0A1J4JI08_9EUKA|nr:Dynein heavy chain family protein [Tritrichomonas foetus]|eukprot:OHS98802.1 Dynein heavy chain family protein [Tritrichomonas foetus]